MVAAPATTDLAEFRRAVVLEVVARARAWPSGGTDGFDLTHDLLEPGEVVVDPFEVAPPGGPPRIEADDSPTAWRYFALTAAWDSPWSVSRTGYLGARCALETLISQIERLAQVAGPAESLSAEAVWLRDRFFSALADELDPPRALETLWQIVRVDLDPAERLALLTQLDQVLQLGLATAARPRTESLPSQALPLIEARNAAREARDWARSDLLRDQLATLGVEAQDTRAGSVYRRVGPGTD